MKGQDDMLGSKRKSLSNGSALGAYAIASQVREDRFGYVYLSDVEGKRALIREFSPEGLSARRLGKIYSSSRAKKDEFIAFRDQCGDLFDKYAGVKNEDQAPVHHFAQNNTHYLVSDFPDGETYGEIVQAYGELNTKQIRTLLDDVLSTMEPIEAAGLVHGSISPDSLFRDDEGKVRLSLPYQPGETGRTPLMALSPEECSAYTAAEWLIDAPQTLGRQSDLYSLGAFCSYVMTGEAPPLAHNRLSALRADEDDPLNLEKLEAACETDKTLFSALRACLRLEPDQRPADIAAFRKALIPQNLPAIIPQEKAVPLPTKTKRRWEIWGVAAAAFIGIVGLVVTLPRLDFGSGTEEPDPQIAVAIVEEPKADAPVVSSNASHSNAPLDAIGSDDALNTEEDIFLETDTLAWAKAEQADTIEAYQAYLGAFGEDADRPGIHFAAALRRIEKLTLESAEENARSEPYLETVEEEAESEINAANGNLSEAVAGTNDVADGDEENAVASLQESAENLTEDDRLTSNQAGDSGLNEDVAREANAEPQSDSAGQLIVENFDIALEDTLPGETVSGSEENAGTLIVDNFDIALQNEGQNAETEDNPQPDTPYQTSVDTASSSLTEEDTEQVISADNTAAPAARRFEAGQFMMGSPASEAGRNSAESLPQSTAIDRPFSMMRHEVTRGEYRAFLNATNRATPSGCAVHAPDRAGFWSSSASASLNAPGFEQTDDHPVVCVSLEDANAYADWISQETGESWRLPTSAEWEYAARSGEAAAFFWGASALSACSNANGGDSALLGSTQSSWAVSACDDRAAFTARVGQYSANHGGLYDMAGNVWEWVSDCEVEQSGICRGHGLRGGSWASSPDQLRSAKRHSAPASSRRNTIGFRLVRED